MMEKANNTTQETVTVSCFQFELIGEFKISVPSKKAYSWDQISLNGIKTKVKEPIRLIIDLIRPELMQSKESVYLIMLDDTFVYVGEFSGSLQSRMTMTENYIWHHKDHLIYRALENNQTVKLYLLENPTADVNGIQLNIGKSIEHHILKNARTLCSEVGNDLVLSWNKRSKR